MPTFYTFLFSFFCCNAFSQGIDFQAFDWDKLQVESKERSRLIFVDFTATWCVPCKHMDKTIFTLPEVGEYFNRKFLCTRLDFDNARALADKYKVTSLPCYLFLDADRNLIYKASGATEDAKSFIEYGKTAIDIWMSARWQRDLKNPNTLYHYALYLLEKKDSTAGEHYQKYIDSQSPQELAEKDRLEFVLEFVKAAHQPAFDYFWKNQAIFAEKLGAELVYATKWLCCEREIRSLRPENPREIDMQKVQPLIARYFPEQSRRAFLQYQMRYYQEILYFPKLQEAVLAFAVEIPILSSPKQIATDYAECAALLYLTNQSAETPNPEHYKTALQWALQSEKESPSAKIYYVLFDIYAALGMETEAVAAEAKAKELKGN